MGLLSLLFPKRCVVCRRVGSYLCQEDRDKIKLGGTFCPVCGKAAINGSTHAKCLSPYSLDGLICLFHYGTPIKELIHELKYRLVADLREVLISEIKKGKRLSEFDFSGFYFVPVPLHRQREAWRGFNQSKYLGTRLARFLKTSLASDVLTKLRDTTPQAKLSRLERLRGAKGTFLGEKEQVKDRQFIVFDDVWTTGATLKEAALVLKRSGARKVWGLVLASSHRY
jgi:ComF family protein